MRLLISSGNQIYEYNDKKLNKLNKGKNLAKNTSTKTPTTAKKI